MKTLPPLTEFQKAILWVLERSPNRMAGRWIIAQRAFPDKWRKRSARGALVGHIDRAARKMPDFVGRLDPKDQFDDATIFLKDKAYA